jgi:hypothetical protein
MKPTKPATKTTRKPIPFLGLALYVRCHGCGALDEVRLDDDDEVEIYSEYFRANPDAVDDPGVLEFRTEAEKIVWRQLESCGWTARRPSTRGYRLVRAYCPKCDRKVAS